MLENLKIKLVKIARDSEKHNFCIEKSGSFSIRDEGSGYVLITPSGVKIEDLREEHICTVDLNGKKIEAIDGIEPNTDMQMHLEIYKARKDVRALMHIIPVYSTTFSVINKVIPPITYYSREYGGYVYVANYEKTKLVESAKDLINKLSTSDACLLENNGIVLVSNDIENILSKAKYVENTAEIYYKALVLNGFKEPKRISRESLK